MNDVEIRIPRELKFSDLNLTRDSISYEVRFNWAPIEQLCAHNQIDVDIFRQDQNEVIELICAWYHHQVAKGLPHDPVMDDLINETLEIARHNHAPLDPGRA